MSVDFEAVIFFGAKFKLNDLKTSERDPMYGKFKYNPYTGVLVKEFKETPLDINNLCDKYRLDYIYSAEGPNNEKEEIVFIGRKVEVVSTYNTDCFTLIKENTLLPLKNEDISLKEILNNELGKWVPEISVQYYLILNTF